MSGPEIEAAGLLDDLFRRTKEYRSSEAFLDMVRFVAEFRSQGPYNAYLLRQQNPRVRFAATARDWEHRHGGRLKGDAKPLVILKPFAPVEFVYDISDVVDLELPIDVIDPFTVRGTASIGELTNLVRNAEHRGIGFAAVTPPGGQAGRATRLDSPERVARFDARRFESGLFWTQSLEPAPDPIQVTHLIEVDDQFDVTRAYATVLHELAHVMCGHLGPVEGLDQRSARGRGRLPPAVAELEAETAAYLVARRAGVDTRSEAYLAMYYDAALGSTESLSQDAIVAVANQLDRWAKRVSRPKKRSSGVSPNLRKHRRILGFE